MADLSIDKTLERVCPWRFTVEVNGREHATRRPLVCELDLLQRAQSLSSQQVTELVDGLFVEPKPSLPYEGRVLFLAKYVEHLREQLPKNLKAVAAEILPATARRPATSGSSTSSS